MTNDVQQVEVKRASRMPRRPDTIEAISTAQLNNMIFGNLGIGDINWDGVSTYRSAAILRGQG